MIRADDLPGLEAACRRAGAIVGASAGASTDAEECHTLLVESFVPGPEIALEGMLAGGELSVLAIFDKPDPLDGPFFEEDDLRDAVAAAAIAPGARRRARARRVRRLWTDRRADPTPRWRIHEGDAWLIEIAGRTIGGDLRAAVRVRVGGWVLEHLVLQGALGPAVRRIASPRGRGGRGC